MSSKAKIALVVIGVLWLFAFFRGNFLHDKPGANDMDLATEVKAFRNIRFKITLKEKLTDGTYSLAVECDYKGKPTGLDIRVIPQGSDTPKKETAGYAGNVVFMNRGPESDRLVEMLNNYYLTRLQPKPMTKEVTFNIVISAGDPKKLELQPVKLELIYPRTDGDHYAKFYLDIDWNRDLLYLAEQNTDYRKAILSALRGE